MRLDLHRSSNALTIHRGFVSKAADDRLIEQARMAVATSSGG
jgi:hypothetical protein